MFLFLVVLVEWCVLLMFVLFGFESVIIDYVFGGVFVVCYLFEFGYCRVGIFIFVLLFIFGWFWWGWDCVVDRLGLIVMVDCDVFFD